MIRYFEHSNDYYWRAEVVDEGVMISHGPQGGEPELDWVDTWEEFGKPPEHALDDVVQARLADGYSAAPIPNIHLEIEKAAGATLPREVREFHQAGRYLNFQDHRCAGLACEVDFVADSVLGNYGQVHYDGEQGRERTFVPISAVLHDGCEDEQRWIGIDPAEATTTIYALYTSGEFEVAYPTFAAFIADLTPR